MTDRHLLHIHQGGGDQTVRVHVVMADRASFTTECFDWEIIEGHLFIYGDKERSVANRQVAAPGTWSGVGPA